MKTDYLFKTTPFDHQLEAWNISRAMPEFALFMEQGTGKSKVIIDTVAWLYQRGLLDAVIVVAPNGVHRNWLIDEIPDHLPDHIPYIARMWESKKAKTKKFQKHINELLAPAEGVNPLRFFMVNIEGITVKAAKEFIRVFIAGQKVMCVVDESHLIKNWNIERSKTLCRLGKLVAYRRILTGTPLTQGPGDIYGQFRYLGEELLGFNSFYAFQSRHTVLVEDVSDDILRRMTRHEMKEVYTLRKIRQKGGKSRYAKMPARNPDGSIRFQRMDELKKKMAPFCFRVTKDECLDLPDKLYKNVYVELSDEQRTIYDQVKEELIYEIEDKKLTAPLIITQMLRLQQIVGGFVTFNDGTVKVLDCPRMDQLIQSAQEISGKAIIWCRFTEEIKAIAGLLGDSAGLYYGAVKAEDRAETIARFQGRRPIMEGGQRVGWDPVPVEDQLKYFISNPKAGGTGLTLHAANNVFYYSNDFALGPRLQSEDRAHRIGQKKNVTYYDFIALGTLDEKVVKALRDKKNLADVITGDPPKNWL